MLGKRWVLLKLYKAKRRRSQPVRTGFRTDVLISLVVAAAAVLQAYSAYQQNEISARDVKIQLNQTRPVFEVRYVAIPWPEHGQMKSIWFLEDHSDIALPKGLSDVSGFGFEVLCSNNRPDNVTIYCDTVYEYRIHTLESSSPVLEKSFPYYGSKFFLERDGNLNPFTDKSNDKFFSSTIDSADILNICSEIEKSKNVFVEVYAKSFLKIEYLNILGETENFCYTYDQFVGNNWGMKNSRDDAPPGENLMRVDERYISDYISSDLTATFSELLTVEDLKKLVQNGRTSQN